MKLVSKKDSKFMKVLSILVYVFNKKFMERYWTTIGQTIYYPLCVKNPLAKGHKDVIEHEEYHTEWNRKYTMICAIALYIFFPLPFFFSGRWFYERGAYLIDIKKGRCTPEAAADELWNNYACPWPKKSMIKWFYIQLEMQSEEE